MACPISRSSCKLFVCVVVAYAGFYLPVLYVSNRATKRKASIQKAWPDALDLMLICVESGMSVEAAFRKVADEIGAQSVELAEEFVLTNAELSFLQERKSAYDNLAARTGLESVRSVAQALVQAERYGTPVAHALRVLANESRDQRMNAAEKKAAALPPKLTVPMILFFLPVLFAVILGPAGIQVSERGIFGNGDALDEIGEPVVERDRSSIEIRREHVGSSQRRDRSWAAVASGPHRRPIRPQPGRPLQLPIAAIAGWRCPIPTDLGPLVGVGLSSCRCP